VVHYFGHTTNTQFSGDVFEFCPFSLPSAIQLTKLPNRDVGRFRFSYLYSNFCFIRCIISSSVVLEVFSTSVPFGSLRSHLNRSTFSSTRTDRSKSIYFAGSIILLTNFSNWVPRYKTVVCLSCPESSSVSGTRRALSFS
jgi:hypothetical protein